LAFTDIEGSTRLPRVMRKRWPPYIAAKGKKRMAFRVSE